VNIFLRELKANLRSLLVWGAVVSFFTIVGFSKFTGYADNPELLAVLDALPEALMAAFNMNAFNLTTLAGFWGVMFSYFALLLSIAAIMWGSDIISKEERDKTVEFSLTLPVTRSRVVTAKTLAAVVNCVGLVLICWAATLIGAAQFSPDSEFFAQVRLGMSALLIMQMVFLALGVLFGAAMKRYRLASSVAVSVLLGTYFLSILSAMNEDLAFLKYFTPFRYFDPSVFLREARLDMTYVGLSAGIIVVCLVAAYLAYSRRDLYI
jgi:ABC-2 type transport system permease protein